jgi:hypothetical protein
VLVPVADDLVSLPGLTPIPVMPMHRGVNQRRKKDERSDEVDNFHGCSPLSLNSARKTGFRSNLALTEALSAKKRAMPKNKEGHGIVLDEEGQERPKDKDRAQQKPGHMPPQPTKKEDRDNAMQPTREKSGF